MGIDEQTQPKNPSETSSPRPTTPILPLNPAEASRTPRASMRSPAWLGPNIQIKGQITGNEDLHIEGKVEGPISLGGHRLTVARSAQVTSEIVAREVVVYGTVDGDLRARDRIEIKKDGRVTGDITTARILVEDGAFVKGKVEIDRSSTPVGADLDSLLSRTTPKSQ